MNAWWMCIPNFGMSRVQLKIYLMLYQTSLLYSKAKTRQGHLWLYHEISNIETCQEFQNSILEDIVFIEMIEVQRR